MSESGHTDQDRSPTISRLRYFAGSPKDFWPLFLRWAAEFTQAGRATLCVRQAAPAPGSDGQVGNWRILLSIPPGGATLPDADFLAVALAEGVSREGGLLAFAVGGEESGEGVVVLEIKENNDPGRSAALVELLGVLPDFWQTNRTVRQLRDQLKGVSGVLDLGLVVAGQKKFSAASFATCNELAARLGCDRVSLGWQDDTVLKLRAISQADKFDSRSTIVRQVEAAMEETFDQDETLIYPKESKSDAIIREHGAYAQEAKVPFLCSVPIRANKVSRGVLLLERESEPFDLGDRALLRVMADQVGPRLADLRELDRWWPVRLWRKLKKNAAGFLGHKHTGPKLAGLGVALLLLFLIFGRLPYSVEAPATVRSDHVVFVTAPFDGFIGEVFFRVGDIVEEGATLVTFDTQELLVQQAAELANLNRYNKEMERARAQNALADMRVAEAQANQARAVLDRTRYHLEQSEIRAPMSGVIVEGDLRKRLGAPVRQGDVLFQQARLDELYVQIEVSERDVHEVLNRTEARMLFAAQTDEAFHLIIERIQPAGMPTPSGVVFRVRAVGAESPPDWWRPGMSGTAKIDTGWRNAGWIFTHRTADWLRRQLWW